MEHASAATPRDMALSLFTQREVLLDWFADSVPGFQDREQGSKGRGQGGRQAP